MKGTLAIIALSTAIISINISPQAGSKQDKDEINRVIRDYIEGYYVGDAKRVEAALNPELAKRVVGRTKEGKDILKSGGAPEMIKMTADQDGPKYYPAGKRRLEIKIFEIDGKMASAKVTAQDWIDYIHLGKVDGKWSIVNIIWKMTPPPK